MQMKKSVLLGAMIAGFAGAASAETQVTLYGLIDEGLIYQSNKTGDRDVSRGDIGGGSQSRIGIQEGQQSGSRWGLRGTEDLGGGTMATFVLESGFTANDGRNAQNRLFGRQSTVGLTGDFGTFDMGRQTNLASRYFEGVDPFALDFYQANMGSAFSAANTVRYDNTLMYQTPTFGGFTLGAGYSFNYDSDLGGNFRTNENNRAITAGAMYLSGPLQVSLSYDQQNLTPSQPKPKSAIIGAAYNFEVVKLGLAYGYTKDGVLSGQFLGRGAGAPSENGIGLTNGAFSWDGLRINSYMVGLTAPIGAVSSLFGSWQRADPNKGLDKTDIYSLGVKYDLSKRTDLYAYGSYADGYGFVDGNKVTTVGAGVRHRF